MSDALKIDRQARRWQKKLIGCWCGHARPSVYKHKDALVAALFLHHGMPRGPLPDDRLELIYAATRRQDPSREAFVTLALADYLEDLDSLPPGVRSAHLPYQLAWARDGWYLNDNTGLPPGMVRANWPDTEDDVLKPFTSVYVPFKKEPKPKPEPRKRVHDDQMELVS